MARASETRNLTESDGGGARSLRAEIWGLVFVTLGLSLFLALVSFSRVDSQVDSETVNLIGPVGAQVANATLYSLGLCAFFFNALLFFCGFALLFGRQLRVTFLEGLGYAVAVPSAAVILHLLLDGGRVLGHKAGGLFGELGAEIGRSLLGSVGTIIFAVAALLLAMTMIFETNPSVLVVKMSRFIWQRLVQLLSRLKSVGTGLLNGVSSRFQSWKLKRSKKEKEPTEPQVVVAEPTTTEPDEAPAAPLTKTVSEPSKSKKTKKDKKPDEPKDKKPAKALPIKVPQSAKSASNKQLDLEFNTRDVRGFKLPSTTLLATPSSPANDVDGERLQATAAQIEEALDQFNVKGEVTGITPGPVVTMFEFEPAPGVKVSKVASLSDDLARVIRAQAVRIAPIPGKGVVGLEVPNEKRDTVYIREILESDAFRKSRAKLPLAIGTDISGGPVVADLVKMPHLLVAGATGAGKSVSVNTMISSLLYHASPEDVRMIMVDPKMLELSLYEDIPHLLIPVVTDPQQAATALKWAVAEMEERYRLLSAMKVRDIVGYNKAVEKLLESDEPSVPPSVPTDEEGQPILKRMPYIVVVIDEFADLMMVASKDVEICVMRLAQKARAAGVHLILATQRPSVDVITGLIKANLPTRISFRVFSKVDSRTVLDSNGAETLLGMGDMLFRAPGRGDLMRVHGAYIDEKEIGRLVKFLKEQADPEYREEILVDPDQGEYDIDDQEADEMYDLAVELVTRERKASISMVQRKLRVGYNRAARMVEMMEHEGVVGASDGRGAREVLAPPPP